MKLTRVFFFQSVSLHKCPLGLCYQGLLCGKEASTLYMYTYKLKCFVPSVLAGWLYSQTPVLWTSLGPEKVSVLPSILVNRVNLNGKYVEWDQENSP